MRDFSEWLEVTENLEDTEVPAPAHIPHDSESERRTKVALGKHEIFKHFWKIEVAAVRLVDRREFVDGLLERPRPRRKKGSQTPCTPVKSFAHHRGPDALRGPRL